MQRSHQLKIVGGIVIGGLLFALPFARRETPAVSPPDAPGDTFTSPLHSVPLYLPAESAPSPAVGLRDQDPLPAAPPILVAAAPGGKSHLEDNGMPPAMPEMYHSFLEERATPSRAAPPRRLDAPAANKQPGDEASLQPRTHRVVDGDTLGRLAQRYWQDAGLAPELFAANRDVLSTPDPLPIGITLKIPARPVKARVSISTQAAPVEELPAPVRQPTVGVELDGPLVPFERQ